MPESSARRMHPSTTGSRKALIRTPAIHPTIISTASWMMRQAGSPRSGWRRRKPPAATGISCASPTTVQGFTSQSIYVDRRGTFRANNARRTSKDPVAEDFSGTAVAETQFSRSMKDLDIDIVFACSGPAKGRIERLWLTLQDRLVKEFALNGIKDETAANAFFPAFLKRFNHEFQRKASDPEPFWKGRIRKDILDMEFCPHFKAVVSKSGSVAFRGGYLVLPARDSRGRLLKDYFPSSVEIVVRPSDDILMRLPDGKVVRPKILSKRPKQH